MRRAPWHSTCGRATITARRLTGRIGAELGGVELRSAADDQIDEVRAALLAHRVVFVAAQDLSASRADRLRAAGSDR